MSDQSLPIRVAWFSTLATESGSLGALYTQAIAPLLAKQYSIEVFTSTSDWRRIARTCLRPTYEGLAVYHYLSFILRDREQPFDYLIYQVEDDPTADFVTTMLPLYPGIAICHDGTLSRIYNARQAHATTGEILNDMLRREYGDHAPLLGDFRKRAWPTSIFDRRYPLGRNDLRAAALVLAMNEALQRSLSALSPSCYRTTFPIEVTKQISPERRKTLRRELDLTEGDVVFGFVGERDPDDRVMTTLRAVRLVREELERNADEQTSQFKVLWIVSEPSKVAWAESCVRTVFGADEPGLNSFRVTSPSPQCNLGELVSLVDVLGAFRFDPLRGTRAAFWFAGAEAIPVMALKLEQYADFPEPSLVLIPPGRGEGDIIARNLYTLVTDLRLRRSIGSALANFLTLTASPLAVAEDLIQIMKTNRGALADLLQQARVTMNQRERELVSPMQRRLSGESALVDEIDRELRRIIYRRVEQDFGWGGELPQ